jgi:imidazolonepropionase-like amidohydrolase
MSRARAHAAVVVVVALSAWSCVAAGTELAITHVTVIDVIAGQALPDRTVIVHDDRIAAVHEGRVAPARGAVVVDGRGKFLIPGLWDMHVHLSWTSASALPLLVATGVTNVRDLGGSLTQIDGWRSRIAAGVLVGPEIVRVGPILNGKSFNRYQMVPGGPEATRGAVRTLHFIGVDAIKVHRRLPRDSYFAAIDEAKKLGIPLVGHVPEAVTPAEASDAGQATIEHTETLFEGVFSAKLKDAELPAAIGRWLASGEADALFARFVRNRTWVTPTLAGYEEAADLLDPATAPDPRYRYVARSQREELARVEREHPMSADELRTLHAHMAGLAETTGRMCKAGVLILAGTDAAGPRLVGFSLHAELRALVRVGMSAADALRTATINPAKALGRLADYGSIEPGKVANLVLLDADPLQRIESTAAIAAVIVRGKLHRRRDLDHLLDESERLAQEN